MKILTFAFTFAAVIGLGATASAETYTPGKPVRADFDSIASVFLDKHCLECHDDITTEADLDLLDLGPVDETNAALWKAIWAQVALEEMPPKDKSQPDVIERLKFSDRLSESCSV